jgi:hypothetical protein
MNTTLKAVLPSRPVFKENFHVLSSPASRTFVGLFQALPALMFYIKDYGHAAPEGFFRSRVADTLPSSLQSSSAEITVILAHCHKIHVHPNDRLASLRGRTSNILFPGVDIILGILISASRATAIIMAYFCEIGTLLAPSVVKDLLARTTVLVRRHSEQYEAR